MLCKKKVNAPHLVVCLKGSEEHLCWLNYSSAWAKVFICVLS